MLRPSDKLKIYARGTGFSLIELMLAMLIGIIIIGGVMSLYISTRNTQRTSQDQLQMIADGRFVINTIAYDLRHAGYWGEADLNQSIRCRKGDADCVTALPAATGDCAASWYIDLEKPITASDDVTNFATTCTSNDYKIGTDVLGVHYADAITVASSALAANITYIRSNYEVGGLFVGAVVPVTSSYEGLKYWEDTPRNNIRSANRKLVAHLYYVSKNYRPGDGIPSLHRVELQPGPIMKDTALLPGVADLQLQYGVDTNTPQDINANSYVNAGNIPMDSTGVPQWGRVRSVKIWVLMRSERKDRDGVAGEQKFTLANKPEQIYNDGYRYYLVSSVVKLRNTMEIDIK